MSDSIVSTKNRVPIAGKDVLPIDFDHLKGTLFHHAFLEQLWNDEEEYPEFPQQCLSVNLWDFNSFGKLEEKQGIAVVNDEEEHDEVEGEEYEDPFFSQGVYFCVRHLDAINDRSFDEIVYIGKTSNLERRFSQHHKKNAFDFLGVGQIYFVSYNPKYYSESDVLWAERQYIDMLKPILNDRNHAPLFSTNSEESKSNVIQEISAIWDQAYNEGIKHGFASAKNQMMDFFDSAIQPPKLK